MAYSGTYKHDHYMAHNEQSTIHKMKETYWTTKQYVKKKLGKKEDEHIVASDLQLDSKLEVFKAIQKSSMDLLRCIEKYQDRLCALSQEENSMGRFLKTESQHDKTRAGKMMVAVGKAQCHASQQRLALRVPLVRLYQEVETFRYRAISDTLMTINRMEAARTEYRGALLWMKDCSEELDPDTYKQLEKFRKVQAQVKKTKARFDRLKLDTMQKIDLLAASRCNMFSHVLTTYQTTLLQFWDKTSRTHSAVAESFKGYQYYEFNMLKELAEPSKKLASETGSKDIPERDTDSQQQEGVLTNEEEEDESCEQLVGLGLNNADSHVKPYRDNPRDDLQGLIDLNSDGQRSEKSSSEQLKDTVSELLLDLGDESTTLEEIQQRQEAEYDITGTIQRSRTQHRKGKPNNAGETTDLLSGDGEEERADLSLLNDILNAPDGGTDDFSTEWQAVFGDTPLHPPPKQPQPPAETDRQQNYMPSSLLDITSSMSSLSTGSGSLPQPPMYPGPAATYNMPQQGAVSGMNPMTGGVQATPSQQQVPKPRGKKNAKDMSAWFNLFADLDPLSNPDAVGKDQSQSMDGAL